MSAAAVLIVAIQKCSLQHRLGQLMGHFKVPGTLRSRLSVLARQDMCDLVGPQGRGICKHL